MSFPPEDSSQHILICTTQQNSVDAFANLIHNDLCGVMYICTAFQCSIHAPDQICIQLTFHPEATIQKRHLSFHYSVTILRGPHPRHTLILSNNASCFRSDNFISLGTASCLCEHV
jgi:hypothetical protein